MYNLFGTSQKPLHKVFAIIKWIAYPKAYLYDRRTNEVYGNFIHVSKSTAILFNNNQWWIRTHSLSSLIIIYLNSRSDVHHCIFNHHVPISGCSGKIIIGIFGESAQNVWFSIVVWMDNSNAQSAYPPLSQHN